MLDRIVEEVSDAPCGRIIRDKRRCKGRQCKPLPRAKAGADNACKEFKVGYLYDEKKEHRSVSASAGNCEAAGRMLRRMGKQVDFSQADERVALIGWRTVDS